MSIIMDINYNTWRYTNLSLLIKIFSDNVNLFGLYLFHLNIPCYRVDGKIYVIL